MRAIGLSSPRGLLLDLDGTLADSIKVLRTVYDAFLAAHAREGSAAEFDELNGPAVAEIVEVLRRRHRLEPSVDLLAREYLDLIDGRYPHEAALAPGARELVAAARLHGVELALVTSSPRRLVEQFLAAKGLVATFAALVTAESVSRRKPDPAPYLYALAELGLDPTDAVAVEDAPNGVRAAASAGLPVYLVAPEGRPMPAEIGALVDGTVRRLDDLIPLLWQASAAP
jgi:HAD superfamily hydrolase (TIGR01509 family)